MNMERQQQYQQQAPQQQQQQHGSDRGSEQSLDEARRMAREVLKSPFSNHSLEVPAFIRRKQNSDIDDGQRQD